MARKIKARIQRRRPRETPIAAVKACLPKRHGHHGKIHDCILKRSGLAKVYKRQGYLFANDERWLDRAYALGQRTAKSMKIKTRKR